MCNKQIALRIQGGVDLKLFNNQIEQAYVKERFSFLLERGYDYSYECLHYSIHNHTFSSATGITIRLSDDFRLHFVNLKITNKETTIIALEYGTDSWALELKGLKEAMIELKSIRDKYGKDRTYSHQKLSRAKFEVYAVLISENLTLIED